jgi:hypothetical protein
MFKVPKYYITQVLKQFAVSRSIKPVTWEIKLRVKETCVTNKDDITVYMRDDI